jgi:hypothetical protein
MTFEDIEFPVYRKYKNGKNYFKILNLGEFEEVQLIGTSVIHKKIFAQQFPEKLFIRDMISDYHSMAFESDEQEWETFISKAKV